MNFDIILEALQDYRRWWEGDEESTEKDERVKLIDEAIQELETLQYTIIPFLNGDRGAVLGLKAYRSMTGEDIENNLSPEDVKEYSEDVYGDDVEEKTT